MFDREIFHVSTPIYLQKIGAVVDALAAEPAARIENFRRAAGVDITALREALAQAQHDLQSALEGENKALAQALTAPSPQANLQPTLQWFAQMYRSADHYLARRGLDDIALTGRLRLGKQAPWTVDHLRRELAMVIPEVSSLRDRLRDDGFGDDFVLQGWEALEALGGQRITSLGLLIQFEEANRNTRKIEARAAALLCTLVAGETTLAIINSREVRKYVLDDLLHAAREARRQLQTLLLA